MSGRAAVAISTVSERLPMAAAAAEMWEQVGVLPVFGNVDTSRAGVAATKNRGLVDLMDSGVEHLFLADDDMFPVSRESWERYTQQSVPHLSLSWGAQRCLTLGEGYSTWSWPRGVLLYVHRSVVEKVGGFRTDYPNMHEHADFSRRVHQAGLTPHMFMDLEQRPQDWFHCEDWKRPEESRMQLAARRRSITTITRTPADRDLARRLWKQYDGVTDFVGYR